MALKEKYNEIQAKDETNTEACILHDQKGSTVASKCNLICKNKQYQFTFLLKRIGSNMTNEGKFLAINELIYF